MKEIKLTKGRLCLIDDEDYPVLSRFSWHLINDLSGGKKVATTFHRKNKKDVTIYIESFLIKLPSFEVVTHIDRNNLNNQKSNLISVASFIPSGRRGKMKRQTSSKYKGVTFVKGKYYCRITYNKKRVFDKGFRTENEAGLAYNKKARELYGELAYQNNIK